MFEQDLPGFTALVNSSVCLALTIILALALRYSSVKKQLRLLRILTTYITLTLLLNLYMVGTSRSKLVYTALALSAASIPLLWLVVYAFWTKGE